MQERIPFYLTSERIKKFAEWCGFTDIRVFVGRPGWDGVSPDGEFKVIDIDLNNLFKYAVPSTILTLIRAYGVREDEVIKEFFGRWLKWYEIVDDFGLALFWSIWEIIKEDNDRQRDLETGIIGVLR